MNPVALRALTLTSIAIGLTACPGPRVGGEVDAGAWTGPLATFTRVQAEVLSLSCASTSCHAGNPPPVAPMSLEPGLSHAGLVGVPSSQAPALLRVAPGAPDQSYLLLKLRGQAATVGGAATRMPLGQDPLSEPALELVQRWIERGAPDD